MVRRRSAAVLGTLCVALALGVAPSAPVQAIPVQATVPGPRVVVTELPALSELPPLPAKGGASQEDDDEVDDTDFGMSGVQTVALGLALAALVAGGAGLALVTRRGRGELPDERPPRTGPVPRRGPR